MGGEDSLTVPLMAIGATGVISVLSNLMPAKVKGIAKNCLEGKYAEARRIHDQVFPMVKAIFLDGNPVGIKYAMKLAGMDSGELRLPLWEGSEGEKRVIEDCMRHVGGPLAVWMM